MTHYKMLDRVPSVVITSKKNELKLYQNNTVFLNDGDNFELRFFNPLQEKIGVEIMFNGIKKGDGLLVLNPGQDLILDRFLDEQRKMLFETYVVDGNNAAAVAAIQNNGDITFNFYREHYRQNYVQPTMDVNYSFPPTPPPPYKPAKPMTKKEWKKMYGKIPYGTYPGWQGAQGYQGTSGAQGPQGCVGFAGVTGTSNTYYHLNSSGYVGTGNTTPVSALNVSNGTYTTSTSLNEYATLYNTNGVGVVNIPNSGTNLKSFNVKSRSAVNERWSPVLETGRVEKGDVSNQSLKSVNADFAPAAFHTITYKLLPISSMNRTIGEVRQYCTDCGYRLRKENWVYCPKCGNKLD